MINQNLVSGIIYGPVQSRRFGLSLGINISGNGKYCSFNCPYCFRGGNQGNGYQKEIINSLPDAEMVKIALIKRLLEYHLNNIADWTIAGNGEPTDNPDFPGIIESLIELRNGCLSNKDIKETKITVLTNGMGLLPVINSNHIEFQKALEKTDRPCLKLDSGVNETWKKIARPGFDVNLREWLEAARGLRNKTIQTMLVKGRINNSSLEELTALKACYKKLAPERIDILTINKPPRDSGLLPLSEEELNNAKNFLLN